MNTLTTHPGFIDLRAFAGEYCADVADPFGQGRKVLPLRGHAVEVGAIHLAPGHGTQAFTGGDTFLIVAQGGLALALSRQAATQTWALTEGGSGVVADGSEIAWTATTPTVLIYMRYRQGAGYDAPGVFMDPHAALTPSGAPLAELLIGPTPVCRNNTQFVSPDGTFMGGTWDSTPYHRRAMPYRHFELMYLLAGSVTFVDEIDREGTFTKGDIFLLEQHAQCSWESTVDVAKVYAIYRPRA